MKRKVTFSFYNYFEPICADVVLIQKKFSAFLGMSAIATYAASNANTTLIVGVVGFIVNELLGCFKIEKCDEN